MYENIKEEGNKLLEQATTRICGSSMANSDIVVVFNTIGWTRNDILTMPYRDEITSKTTFVDMDGNQIKSQTSKDGIILFVDNIPAYGFKKIRIVNENKEVKSSLSEVINNLIVEQDHLENDYYSIDLNELGEITSLIDKRSKRQVCADKPMNVLKAYEDKPLRFDAWDIDVFYSEKPYGPMELISKEVVERGPIRGVLRLTWKFNNSLIIQDMTIYKDKDRIDFVTQVSWKEEQVLLKAHFPVDIHASEATYDIQFGNINRPTHTNTEWDFAKFEVSAHKWVDMSEGNYGVSLLNDCKYGYDIHDNVIGITLIKSPISPDETADRTDHCFTYSLYPHKGTWQESDVQKSAMELNLPLLDKRTIHKDKLCDSFGLISVNCDHMVIDTVKRAEDEKAYIIRLYEYKNRKEQDIIMSFGIPVKKVVETNLIERDLGEVDISEGQLHFDISGYEIKTYKVYF
jgi:alpha-mannosidase